MSDKPKKPTKGITNARKSDAPRKVAIPNPTRNVSYRGNPSYRGAKAKRRSGRMREWLQSRRWWSACVRVIFAGFIMAGLAMVYFAAQLPDIRKLETIKKQQGITIESADGRVLANYGDVYGRYIPYDEIPKPLVLAVIATEDRRFFEHHGVDFFGIARAMVTNLAHGQVVQGGSTVTQQVAKNVFLTPERSISRKLQEVLLAFWLEARFSKKEIMAIYLNRVYLGGGSFGVDAASRRFFNKPAQSITLYESALIAGLLKAPSRYSPAASAERARARVHQVLLNMVDAGYLKKKDVEPTLANYAKAPSHTVEGGDVRYYTDWIVDSLPDIVGQIDDDMIVTTSMDTLLQTKAADALQNIIGVQGPKKNVTQGALVAMQPDGAVQALVGGLDYSKSQFNRAVQAKRQPGSSFKLFVYLAALEAGLTPLSNVLDAPITLQVGNKTWSPDNFEVGGYRGEIPMVEAIRHSLNTVSVRLSQYTGLKRVSQMAERLGIPNIPSHPSVALGSVEATLLEMTGAYAHMPNGGSKVVPYGVMKIRTRDGKEIYKRAQPNPENVLAKGTVQMMNYLLVDVARRGTGTKAAIAGYQVAGKTGTSQDYKDAWFIGYTAQLVTGVWVGNDDNKSMKRVTGGGIPSLVWHEFMTHAMAGKPAKAIPTSAGSSDGLLPWLFGGEPSADDTTSDDSAADAAEEPEHSTVPDNSPFGVENNGNEPLHSTRNAPLAPSDESPRSEPARGDGGIAPAPAFEVPQERPATAPPAPSKPAGEQQGDALSPEFWDKLMKKAPVLEKVKVEYSYPGE